MISTEISLDNGGKGRNCCDPPRFLRKQTKTAVPPSKKSPKKAENFQKNACNTIPPIVY